VSELNANEEVDNNKMSI